MKFPRFVRQIGKRVVKSTPVLRRHFFSSTDYRVLRGADEARELIASSTGWLAERTVRRQERAYQELIAAMAHSEPRLDLKVAAEAVAATGIGNPSLLDVGCGSGYYSDVFAALVAGGVRYTGVDYSDVMIARARARSPQTKFEVADAIRLPYADGAFDIVFNGVSLMHVVDYPAVIREAARVAGSYCIFHTVPVFLDHRTMFLRKYAYGAPVVEVVFGKLELMTLCHEAGLRLQREWPSIPYDVSEPTGHASTAETWLFSVLPR